MIGMATGFPSFDSAVGGLELRKTYLLVGSKESGKEEFAYRLIASALSSRSAAVYIVTNKAPNDLLSEFTAKSISVSQYLGSTFKFIDDFSRNVSPTVTDNNYTKVLNGPLDLTGLSVALSTINGDFLKDGKGVVNVFDSISSLLLYNNPATLFRFLQFICGRAKVSGVTTIFILDNQMHPPEVTETIKSLSDGIISLKLENGRRFFTLTGVSKEVLNWTPL